MGIGAVITLVIGGAGASLPEMVMLKWMFRWPVLFAFLFSVFGIAITTGYLAEAFVQWHAPTPTAIENRHWC